MSRRDESPDLDDTLYVTTDNLGKADAFITSAERLIGMPGGGSASEDEDGEHDEENYGHGTDHDSGRLRNNLAHLIESAKEAVRAAQYAHSRTVAQVDRHRAESERAVVEVTAVTKRRGKA